jgi:8-oxo-dGTP pyrophosphatase MutT (NUDIX family)
VSKFRFHKLLTHEGIPSDNFYAMPLIRDGNNSWETLCGKEIYRNPWIVLTEYQVLRPDGESGIYGVVAFQNKAIGILPVDAEGRVALVGQWRFPLGCYSWEIPEGGGPLGTDYLEAARRELMEETGLHASSWDFLMRMHLSNSVTDEEALIYVATGLTQGQAKPEGSEDISLAWVTLQEALELIREGRITDSMTVAALQAWALRKLNK